MLLYSSDELRAISCKSGPPKRHVRKAIFSLRLWRPMPWRSTGLQPPVDSADAKRWICNIHRMFCHDRRQRVIENDRLFDVGLPHLPPLTPCHSPSTTDRWITVGVVHSTEQLWAPLSLICHCLRIRL